MPPRPKPPWYHRFELGAFVDGFFNLNWNFSKPQSGTHAAFRAYDDVNGFSLAWAGLDVTYPARPVGATASLRFGPSATIYAGSDADIGLEFLKQGYVTWAPLDELTLDFGKMDTIFGAEVAESQNNFNYTRGAVYWLAQPLFHTGFRAAYAPSDEFVVKALAVNGWNNTIDNNAGKTFGLQLGLTPIFANPDTEFGAYLGYLVGPEQDDIVGITCEEDTTFRPDVGCVAAVGQPERVFFVDQADNNTQGLRHLVDLVVTFQPVSDFALVANGDLGFERRRDPGQDFETAMWWGAMLGARYQIGEVWAAALRGEIFGDPDGNQTGTHDDERTVNFDKLVTGTLTVEAAPADYLLIRLDNRIDHSLDDHVFLDGIRALNKNMFTTTLGVVAHTP